MQRSVGDFLWKGIRKLKCMVPTTTITKSRFSYIIYFYIPDSIACGASAQPGFNLSILSSYMVTQNGCVLRRQITVAEETHLFPKLCMWGKSIIMRLHYCCLSWLLHLTSIRGGEIKKKINYRQVIHHLWKPARSGHNTGKYEVSHTVMYFNVQSSRHVYAYALVHIYNTTTQWRPILDSSLSQNPWDANYFSLLPILHQIHGLGICPSKQCRAPPLRY